MRPIDADMLWLEFGEKAEEIEFYHAVKNPEKVAAKLMIHWCMEVLGSAPTIDPEDLRPRGEWIEREHEDARGNYKLFHCSRCDEPNARKKNYCPNCGADMRERKRGKS